MKDSFNNLPALKAYRRKLRNALTPAEAMLWGLLKSKQLEGRRFRRQHSIGNYILDFYCTQEKLCIELDGAHHYTPEGMEYDTKRTAYLNSVNINVIRFENSVVFDHSEQVLEEIKKCFVSTGPPPPAGTPPSQEES